MLLTKLLLPPSMGWNCWRSVLPYIVQAAYATRQYVLIPSSVSASQTLRCPSTKQHDNFNKAALSQFPVSILPTPLGTLKFPCENVRTNENYQLNRPQRFTTAYTPGFIQRSEVGLPMIRTEQRTAVTNSFLVCGPAQTAQTHTGRTNALIPSLSHDRSHPHKRRKAEVHPMTITP
jgi:hypothetical protein